MKNHEIENWAYRVIQQVQQNKPVEDNRVELKSEWPTDPKKTARQIAGHANSAHGEPILWMIGLDEKNGVIGSKNEEVSTWLNAIKSCFDEGVCPDFTVLNIGIEQKTIISLFITTDRPPYVIKNPEGGQITREIPWREGNSTRSAYRHELLNILSPINKNPTIEILSGSIRYHPIIIIMEEKFRLNIIFKLYIFSNSLDKIIIPYHKCSVEFIANQDSTPVSFSQIWFETTKSATQQGLITSNATESELLIIQAGLTYLRAISDFQSDIYFEKIPDEIEIKITINTLNSLIPIILKCKLNRIEKFKSSIEKENIWQLNSNV